MLTAAGGFSHRSTSAGTLVHLVSCSARESALVPSTIQGGGEKDDNARRDELLQRPSAPVPLTAIECVLFGHVVQVRVAKRGEGVGAVHRVNRLRQLRATRFVDAAGVDPCQRVPVAPREVAESLDLLADVRARILARRGAASVDALNVLIGLFLAAPTV